LTSIRPLERDDLPQVASLYEHVMRSGSRTPPPGLAPYFERNLFDCPSADAEIPSLVYVEDGKVVGFIASYARPMRLDGRPIRLACSGQLVADPEAHAVGALLMRKYLSGPQDLTITDGATEAVRHMWVRLGGAAADLSSLRWVRVFRPWRYAGDELCRQLRLGALTSLLRPLWAAMDAVTTRLVRRSLRTDKPDALAEVLTAESLSEQVATMDQWLSLHPDYDARYLGWIFEELERVTVRGTLVRMLVRGSDGQVLGWYLYFLEPGGVSEVLQVAARDGELDEVLDHLFHHARTNGAAALQGRMEPRLVDPLLRRNCIPARNRWTLVHSRDPAVLDAIASRRALLTRLEGEWWMSPHLEPLD
jgi:hypothetical protein